MKLLEDEIIKDLINSEQFNPWQGTPFEGYKQLNNVQKGNFGEKVVKIFMKNSGHIVEERKSITDGYDAIIDGIKTEIKFSLAQTDNVNKCIKPDTFVINHVSCGKDWDRLIFLGINLDESFYFKYFTKDEFIKHFKDTYFNTQQGGSSSSNDDYMCSGNKLISMLHEMKDISQW